jgi:hypothetical protein
MSKAENEALARDLVVNIAKPKDVLTAPNLYTYQDDARLLIEYRGGTPHGLMCSSTVTGGAAVVVLHRGRIMGR